MNSRASIGHAQPEVAHNTGSAGLDDSVFPPCEGPRLDSIPDALQERGIRSLSTSLQPHQRLSFAHAFTRIYRPLLQARLEKEKQPCVSQ